MLPTLRVRHKGFQFMKHISLLLICESNLVCVGKRYTSFSSPTNIENGQNDFSDILTNLARDLCNWSVKADLFFISYFPNCFSPLPKFEHQLKQVNGHKTSFSKCKKLPTKVVLLVSFGCGLLTFFSAKRNFLTNAPSLKRFQN